MLVGNIIAFHISDGVRIAKTSQCIYVAICIITRQVAVD